MIIKLAQFSSELEKEAGLWGAIKASGHEAIKKPKIGLETIVDELAAKKNWTKAYTRERLEAAGNKGGGLLNDITGLDVTGQAGKGANAVVQHIKDNAPAYGGGALLAGGGAYAYKRNKK